MTPHNDHDHLVDKFWDGIERRVSDRRYHDIPPYYPYLAPHQSSQDNKNVANTTLTLQQIGSILIVVGSLIFGGFSAWSNLNKDLDIQKYNFEQFKNQISRDVTDAQDNIKELRKLSDELRAQNQRTSEMLERRIQDLDTSISQIYQKVSSK